MKLATICFFERGSKMLLALKKRGFLVGLLNGYGGKFDSSKGDRTIMDCALRETSEESKVIVLREDAELVGIVDFYEAGVHMFRCSIVKMYRWKGKIVETEEMGRARVFRKDNLPWQEMPVDKGAWFPKILAGERRHWEVHQVVHQGEIVRFVDLGPLTETGDTPIV